MAEQNPQSCMDRFRNINLIRTLRIAGGVTGLVVIALGIFTFATIAFNPTLIVNALYQIIFGILMVICEIRWMSVLRYFRFLTHYLGLGLFYIFVGGLALGGQWWQIAVAVALLSVGICYSILGCFCRRMDNTKGNVIFQKKAAPGPSAAGSSSAAGSRSGGKVEPSITVSTGDVAVTVPVKQVAEMAQSASAFSDAYSGHGNEGAWGSSANEGAWGGPVGKPSNANPFES